MRFLKPLFFAFCFFITATGPLQAQNLIFSIQTILHGSDTLPLNNVLIDSAHVDSLIINATLTSHDSSTLHLDSISFQYSLNGVLSPGLMQASSLAGDTLSFGQSFPVTFKLLNDSGSFPSDLPTGSSVVIWPVYSNLTKDSGEFILTYVQDTATGINDLQNLYNNVLYNSREILINFNNVEKRVVQLYNPMGCKIYEGESDAIQDEIDWSALPASIYILRIRQGYQSVSLKLRHL